jgi:hypothetical protein
MHFTVGAGFNIPIDDLTIEASGKLGWVNGDDQRSTKWRRSWTGSLAFVLVDHVVISVDRRWFRTPQTRLYYSAEDYFRNADHSRLETLWNWKEFHAVSLGFRF